MTTTSTMNQTQENILTTATKLLARDGHHAFSIRSLAAQVAISPSVIYHYHQDKDELLKAVYQHNNRLLGQKRAQLPACNTAEKMLKQRIEFQLDHAQAITAVLKYYLGYRHTFPKFQGGYVPAKTSLHIEEVLKFAQEKGEFIIKDIHTDAKVITHAINGYLLEYYPDIPKGPEKQQLINNIHQFLMRALKK